MVSAIWILGIQLLLCFFLVAFHIRATLFYVSRLGVSRRPLRHDRGS